jgi:hypothetical protein
MTTTTFTTISMEMMSFEDAGLNAIYSMSRERGAIVLMSCSLMRNLRMGCVL